MNRFPTGAKVSAKDGFTDGRETTDRPQPCVTCKTPLQGEWCYKCGERRFDRNARSVRRLLGDAVAALFDLDGRFWRSGAALLHPGKLSNQWIAGQRRRWLGPMSLFFMINVVYFLFPPATDFDLTLYDQLKFQPWSEWATSIVNARLEDRAVDLDTYAAAYRARSGTIAKSLIIWHIPWIALVLFIWSASRKWLYAEHLVVATHGFTFLLAFAVALEWVGSTFLRYVLTKAGAASQVYSGILISTLLVVSLIYWSLMCRRVYGFGRLRTLVSGPVFFIGLALAHFSYRLVQFILTFLVT